MINIPSMEFHYQQFSLQGRQAKRADPSSVAKTPYLDEGEEPCPVRQELERYSAFNEAKKVSIASRSR